MIQKGYANAMNFEHPFYYDEKLVDCLLFRNNFEIIKKQLFKKDHSIMYVTKLNSSLPKSHKYKFKIYSEYKKNLKNINEFYQLINKLNKVLLKLNNNKQIYFSHEIISKSP